MIRLPNFLLGLRDIPKHVPCCDARFPPPEILDLYQNEFLGSMPAQICDLRQENLKELTANCGGATPAVSCDCCTTCV